jgi:hypothetical protein
MLYAVRDLPPGAVPVRPEGHGLAVLGEGLEGAEGRRPPVDVPDDDGDHPGFAGLMPFQGPSHFNIIAVIRGDEIGAYQEEDNTGALQIVVDLPLPLQTGGDKAVVPEFDELLTLENFEMITQLLTELVIFVGIADEHHDIGLFLAPPRVGSPGPFQVHATQQFLDA